MGGFPRAFSKSLLRNVLVEYAVFNSEPVVGGRLFLSAARLEYKHHRNSFTSVHTLDLYGWQTNRSNWSNSSCDRSRGPNDSKALSMSSSQAINTLKRHFLVVPANRPDMPDPVRAWLKHVCVLTCYTLAGLGCLSSSFPSL